MMKKAETKTADAILERPYPVTIGGVTYNVAPPTTETLILASEEIAKLPNYQIDHEESHLLSETLRIAKDCRGIGNVLAILILGSEGLTEVVRKRRFLRFKEVTVDKKAELASIILKKMRPSEIDRMTVMLLVERMEISSFFGFTTSLIEINLTKPTREVGKATRSGR